MVQDLGTLERGVKPPLSLPLGNFQRLVPSVYHLGSFGYRDVGHESRLPVDVPVPWIPTPLSPSKPTFALKEPPSSGVRGGIGYRFDGTFVE